MDCYKYSSYFSCKSFGKELQVLRKAIMKHRTLWWNICERFFEKMLSGIMLCQKRKHIWNLYEVEECTFGYFVTLGFKAKVEITLRLPFWYTDSSSLVWWQGYFTHIWGHLVVLQSSLFNSKTLLLIRWVMARQVVKHFSTLMLFCSTKKQSCALSTCRSHGSLSSLMVVPSGSMCSEKRSGNILVQPHRICCMFRIHSHWS